MAKATKGKSKSSGRKTKLSPKQLRYLFAVGFLSASGKGSARKLVTHPEKASKVTGSGSKLAAFLSGDKDAFKKSPEDAQKSLQSRTTPKTKTREQLTQDLVGLAEDKTIPEYKRTTLARQMVIDYIQGGREPGKVTVTQIGKEDIGLTPKAVDFLRRMIKPTDPPLHVDVNLSLETDRAYASMRKGIAHVSYGSSPGVILHEMAHVLEYQRPDLARKAQKFVSDMSDGSGTHRLRDLGRGNQMYRPDEVAYKPKKGAKVEPYALKYYSHGATEVLSMGLQSLYEDAAKFAKKYPDHYKFMMEVLSE